jgi:hypothetical protein
MIVMGMIVADVLCMIGARRTGGFAVAAAASAAGRRLVRRQVFGGIGDELRAAAGAAEIVGLACVLGLMPGGGGIDIHAADGISDGTLSRTGGVLLAPAAALTFVLIVFHRHDVFLAVPVSNRRYTLLGYRS